jgi:hypothetical protein
MLIGVPVSSLADTVEAEADEAPSSEETGESPAPERAAETSTSEQVEESASLTSASTPAQKSPPSEDSAPAPIPVLSAAEHVQKALDRLATSQALVIASEQEQDAAARAELSLQLLSARRSLEQALVAIGKLEGAGELRALLEESGLVLTEGEKASAVAEQDRLRGLSPERFQKVVAAMTSVSFSEGRMQQLKAELEGQGLTAAQSWALVELFDFSRDRVEALVFLHPKIVDPENFSALLGGLKFESDRETVRSRLGLEG